MDEEILTALEEAFLKGFMDASALTPRKNPFIDGGVLAAEYDRGYSRSMEETGI